MNKDQIFTAWAPDASLWSQWAKPVLFAHVYDVPMAQESSEAPPTNVNWCPPIEEKVVLVVDLPGADGVWMGMSLAERGYRPVPLYNAIPLPGGQPFMVENIAAVNVFPIVDVLRE